MRLSRQAERYADLAIVLHWVIAALILFNLCVGYFLTGFPPAARAFLLRAHISAGMTVLVLTAVRVAWRLMHAPPPYPPTMKVWERSLAHLVHFGLYVAMVLMPLLGWAIVSAHSPKGSPGTALEAATFAREHPHLAARAKASGGSAGAGSRGADSGPKIWWTIPFPLIEPIGESVGGVEPQKVLHEKFIAWHGIGGCLTILLLVLHVLGALKHQFIDQEPQFARMGIGSRRRRRAAEV